MSITVRPIHPDFVAEISGVDLAAPLQAADRALGDRMLAQGEDGSFEYRRFDDIVEAYRAPPPPRAVPGPTLNPWRHVGRNDPCPCGSGKKAERSCLAA